MKTLTVPNVKRSLKYVFTEREIITIAKAAAELQREGNALDNDKKRLVADFGAKLAKIEADKEIAANRISSGYEYRDIECIVDLETPTRGKKTLTRLDDGSVASVEEMTDSDRQLILKFEEENKPAPKARGKTVAANGSDEEETPRVTSADSAN